MKIEEIDEKEEVVEEPIVTPEPVKEYRYYRLTSFGLTMAMTQLVVLARVCVKMIFL